jgi:hypothetical protein
MFAEEWRKILPVIPASDEAKNGAPKPSQRYNVILIRHNVFLSVMSILMKWSMDHVLTWGYMSKKDIAIRSE